MPYHPVDHHHALVTPKVCTFLVLCWSNAPVDTTHSCLTIPFSTSTYQDTVSWQYATSWDAPKRDAGATSGHPSSISLNPLGMVSASNKVSTFTPPLPSPRAAVHPRNPFFGATIHKYCCSYATHVHHCHPFCLLH